MYFNALWAKNYVLSFMKCFAIALPVSALPSHRTLITLHRFNRIMCV